MAGTARRQQRRRLRDSNPGWAINPNRISSAYERTGVPSAPGRPTAPVFWALWRVHHKRERLPLRTSGRIRDSGRWRPSESARAAMITCPETASFVTEGDDGPRGDVPRTVVPVQVGWRRASARYASRSTIRGVAGCLVGRAGASCGLPGRSARARRRGVVRRSTGGAVLSCR